MANIHIKGHRNGPQDDRYWRPRTETISVSFHNIPQEKWDAIFGKKGKKDEKASKTSVEHKSRKPQES